MKASNTGLHVPCVAGSICMKKASKVPANAVLLVLLLSMRETTHVSDRGKPLSWLPQRHLASHDFQLHGRPPYSYLTIKPAWKPIEEFSLIKNLLGETWRLFFRLPRITEYMVRRKLTLEGSLGLCSSGACCRQRIMA